MRSLNIQFLPDYTYDGHYELVIADFDDNNLGTILHTLEDGKSVHTIYIDDEMIDIECDFHEAIRLFIKHCKS